jgi:membrane protease YdiL (CAAX protease family)
MLDPTSPLAQVILWAALVAMVAWLVVRALRRDRREYARFKRYRSTKRRQAMLRKWLRESFLVFGGLALGILVLIGALVPSFMSQLTDAPVIGEVRGWLAENPGFAIGAGVGAVLGIVALTLLGMREARKEEDLIVVGDIQALLPRNRQELRIGALLSLNAGVVEELLFRLALPVLLFALTGSALVAVVVSVLVFGGLHAYQGIAGVLGTTVVGALMMLVLALTGSIVWPIVLHALFNLRSLVLLPVMMHGVHKIDGRQQPFIPRAVVARPGPSTSD